jgi:hypothetical protein
LVSAMSDGFHMSACRTRYGVRKRNITLCSNY